jgi:signal transduction histidine kinase
MCRMGSDVSPKFNLIRNLIHEGTEVIILKGNNNIMNNNANKITLKSSLNQSKILEWLVKAKATNGIRSIHFWIVLLMAGTFVFFTYAVYPNFYDVYVIFLFPPLLYAAVIYRLRGATFGSIAFVAILAPHALPLALEPYVLVRSFVFLAFPFLVSGLFAVTLNNFERQWSAYREILELNETLNSYIDRLEKTQKQLLQVEKLHALGQLSAAIAHEINNPLAGVLVYVQLLRKKIKNDSFNPEETDDILSKMETALSHSTNLVRSLLDFARQSTPTLKPLVIGEVIDQALALVGHQAMMKKIIVERNETSDLPLVKGDFSQLQQVFINLTVNAIQAMSEGGTLTIGSSADGQGFLKVIVQDTGVGIPPENIEKLFTPFFSTKEAVKGVGLGLAVSYGIIERHGGRIEVQSEVNKGSVFSVYLPLCSEVDDRKV